MWSARSISGGESPNSAQAAAATLSPFVYSWGSPVSFAGLNAGQILTNFPGTEIVGAMFAQNGGSSITVTPGSGSPIVFAPANTSWAGLAGGNGFTTGASTNSTGNANFNSCLNAFYYDSGPHIITLSNLVVGRQYSVQLFALDDRSLSPAGSARTVNWQNPADSINVSPTYSMADNKYIVMTFMASNTVQAIQENLLNSGYGNFNCLVLRAVVAFAAPAGLTAMAVSTSQVNLTWNTLTNATSYNVKRSLTNGGPYTVIASGVTATNYQDTGLVASTMYYYVVSAIVSGTETSNSTQVAVATLSPTLGSLAHRYSFSETGGTNFADSVGGPVWTGTLPSGGTLSGGQLYLLSRSQQYASLPSGIVGSLSNCTVMAWVTLTSLTNWIRVFDFGNDTSTYMFLTPQGGSSGMVRFAITTGGSGGEQQINGSATLNVLAKHQMAVTMSGGTGILYVDGVAVGTNSSMTITPSSLGSTVNNYIGKSQLATDPYLNGWIDEIRIYNVGLSAAEIAASAALGSSQLLSSNSPAMGLALTGTNMTVSWPVGSAGFTLQVRTNLVLGDWMNVTSPAPQIVGGQWQIALPPATNAGSVYYRLMK